MDVGKDAPIIELEEVSLQFGEQKIFQSFSIQLFEGDSLVMVGPSGSGKSTLLKLMAGLITPQKGRILYREKDLLTLSKKERARRMSEVGMLFQQNALFDSMTVYENLRFVVDEVQGHGAADERKSEILQTLEAVGLDHVPSHFPSEISGGMQKRLGIARALVLKPRLVFYDDPTAGLDPITSRKIVSMIMDLKEQWGGTLVTVTNDMMRAYQLAGQCMICFPGEFLQTGSAEQTRACQDPRVQQFINGFVDGPLGGL